MWDFPRPGLKPVSPALAGGFLTTVPPAKPSIVTFVPCFLTHLDIFAFLLKYVEGSFAVHIYDLVCALNNIKTLIYF